MTGVEDATNLARNPNENYGSWTQACGLAVYLHYAFNESYTGTTREEILDYYMSKPAGITNQKYFVSEKAWENGYTAATGTFAFKDGPAKRVRDVVLNVGNIHEEVDINIFFDFK